MYLVHGCLELCRAFFSDALVELDIFLSFLLNWGCPAR